MIVINIKKTIYKFRGEYDFLSNFHVIKEPWSFLYHPCKTSEHAYQLSKTLDVKERIKISNSSLKDVKKFGREATIRPDWDDVKVGMMYKILYSKFSIPYLRDKLISTEDALLIEGNTWHDNFWGWHLNSYDEFEELDDYTKALLGSFACECNHLGRLLMMVRQSLIADIQFMKHEYLIDTYNKKG